MMAQSLGAGTLKGAVTDATGAALPVASVGVSNAITGFARLTQSGPDGSFVMENLPQNTYVLRVMRDGFQTATQTVVVRTTVPVEVTIELALAGQQTSINVAAESGQLVENVPVPSHTVDRLTLAALPLSSGSGLNDAIIL